MAVKVMVANVQELVPPTVRLSIKESEGVVAPPALLSTSKTRLSPEIGGVLAPVQLALEPVPPQLTVVPAEFHVSAPLAAKAAGVGARPSRIAKANRGFRGRLLKRMFGDI